MKPKLTVTSDFTAQFNDIIRKFRKDKVLVGIPEEENAREPDPDSDAPPQEIGNAALLAINNFGSPANNIPARPVMEIGIRNAQDAIAEQFRQAAVKALSTGLKAVGPAYERAGIIAANSIKKAINQQEGIEEPSEATIKSRESRGFKGTKALVVTGQMRNAITHVVKEG
jgi:hypothetical protein